MGKKHHGQNQVRKRDRHSSDGLKKFAHDYSKDYSDPKWPYAQGKMDKYGFYDILIYYSFCFLFVCLYLVFATEPF